MDRTCFEKPLVLTALVALGLGAIEIDALLEKHDALGDYPPRSSFAAAQAMYHASLSRPPDRS
jgi:hypothetical protein